MIYINRLMNPLQGMYMEYTEHMSHGSLVSGLCISSPVVRRVKVGSQLFHKGEQQYKPVRLPDLRWGIQVGIVY